MDNGRAGGIARWIEEVATCRSVHLGEVLPGATTSTVMPVLGMRADGWAQPFVVKIYDVPGVAMGAADVRNDATALAAAAEVGIPAPLLVDADPEGRRLGVPALVMTRLGGAARALPPQDSDTWIEGLAGVLQLVAAAPHPTTSVRGFAHWFSVPVDRPWWMPDGGLWAEVNDVLERGLSSATARFIHRDFHPMNVLWDGDAVTGIVDWVNASIGPIEVDVARCRMNILVLANAVGRDGVALADRFLAECRALGIPADPVWDLEFLADAPDPAALLASAGLVDADPTAAGAALAAATSRALEA